MTNTVTVWCGSCSSSDRKTLQWVVKSAQCTIGSQLPATQDIYHKWCLRRSLCITGDHSHSSHRLFTLLPSGPAKEKLLPHGCQLPELFPQMLLLLFTSKSGCIIDYLQACLLLSDELWAGLLSIFPPGLGEMTRPLSNLCDFPPQPDIIPDSSVLSSVITWRSFLQPNVLHTFSEISNNKLGLFPFYPAALTILMHSIYSILPRAAAGATCIHLNRAWAHGRLCYCSVMCLITVALPVETQMDQNVCQRKELRTVRPRGLTHPNGPKPAWVTSFH